MVTLAPPSSEPTDFPTECKGFFNWKLKDKKHSYYRTLESSIVKDIVQGNLCKVKLCATKNLERQEDQQEINLFH